MYTTQQPLNSRRPKKVALVSSLTFKVENIRMYSQFIHLRRCQNMLSRILCSRQCRTLAERNAINPLDETLKKLTEALKKRKNIIVTTTSETGTNTVDKKPVIKKAAPSTKKSLQSNNKS